MTRSSHGGAFRITGAVWEESLKEPVMWRFDDFLLLAWTNGLTNSRVSGDSNIRDAVTGRCYAISRRSADVFQMLLQWRHNERNGVSNHQSPMSRLLMQPFVRAQIKENIKTPRHWEEFLTGFPSQRVSKAENISIWWRHHTNICRDRRVSNAISSVKLCHVFKRRATETRGRFYASVINRPSKVGLEHMPRDFSVWGFYIIPVCLCLHKTWKLEEMCMILCDNIYYVELQTIHFYEPQGEASWLTYQVRAAWIRTHMLRKVWDEITTCKDDLSVPYSMDT